MSKKQMQESMKAMLAKTKVGTQVTTSSSTFAPAKKNFIPKKPQQQPAKPKPPAHKSSSLSSATQKQVVVNKS